jgi:hypothetical protein
MQFRIEITRPVTDLRLLEDALLALDPAALVDIDPAGVNLRFASVLCADELCRLVTDIGYPVERGRIIDIPSDCCGGCAG